MFLRTEIIPTKLLVGKRIQMSLAQNKTADLWRNFMPHRNDIAHREGTAFYSLEIYPANYFDAFNPNAQFEKWAAVEVNNHSKIPPRMEKLVVPEGLYAVFLHHGSNEEAAKTYGYIFREWLPTSEFSVDHRPHFAVMDHKYKKDDPSSEEEIWIPVKKK